MEETMPGPSPLRIFVDLVDAIKELGALLSTHLDPSLRGEIKQLVAALQSLDVETCVHALQHAPRYWRDLDDEEKEEALARALSGELEPKAMLSELVGPKFDADYYEERVAQGTCQEVQPFLAIVRLASSMKNAATTGWTQVVVVQQFVTAVDALDKVTIAKALE